VTQETGKDRTTKTRQLDSERFAYATLDALADHIAVLDARGTITAVNRAWREFAGANSPSSEGLNEGANYFAACARVTGKGAGDGGRFAAGLRAVIEGELDEFSLEYPCHSSTRQSWFVARATRFEFDGEVRAVVTHADITERKLAGEATRFQSHLLDTVEQAVIATDLTGKITYWNRFAEKLYGWPAAEVTGRNIIEITPSSEAQARAAEIMSHLSAGRSWSGELTLRRRDGTTFPAFVTDTPIYDDEGTLVGIVGISSDGTERKRAEDSLQQLSRINERQLQTFDAVISSVQDFIYMFDLSGRFTYVNRPLLNLWQKKLEQAVGRNFFDLDYPQDLAAKLQRQIQEVITTRRPLKDETPYTSAFGTRAYEYIFVPLIAADGTVEAVAGVTRDITERKQAEEERERLLRSLEEERSRLVYLFTQAPTFVAVLSGEEHVFEVANPPYLRLVGHRDVLGKSVREALPEIAGQGYFELLDEVFRTGEPHVGKEMPVTVRHEPDGEPEDRFLDFVYQPMFDADGSVSGIFVHGVDITERKRAEAALRESEEWLRAIFDASRDGILVEDDERIAYVNRAYARLFGFEDAAELKGAHISGVVSDADKERTIGYGKRRARGEAAPTLYEFKGRRKNGEPLDLEASVSISNIAGKAYITTMVRDIAKRKRAEESLRRSESMYRLLLEQASDGIHTYDLRGDFIETNSKLCQMLGYTRAELLRLNVKDLIPAADLAATPIRFDELQAGKTLLTERWLRRKDGTLLPVEISGRMIQDGVLQSIIRDISERKLAEEQLRTAYDELERRVRERTDELARANDTLKAEIAERLRAEDERRELLRRLVTAQEDERRRISRELHDQMGQRLAALMIGLKTLDEHSYGRQPALAGLRQLQEITDELSREAHALAWRLRPAALDDLGLHTALYNYVKDWAERSRVQVDFYSAGIEHERLPLAHETALYRIAQEALTNILKHSQANRVSIILERRADHVFAVVEDNGKGFDVETLTNMPPKERNLGLLGMRERATLLGGTLEIESAPGAGASVFVRIPLAAGGEEGEGARG
jgi:PAS domain S-box-containing protein